MWHGKQFCSPEATRWKQPGTKCMMDRTETYWKKDEPVVVVGDAAVPGAADSEVFGRLFAVELRLIRL